MLILPCHLVCDDRENPVLLKELAAAGAEIARLQAADYFWRTPAGPAVIQRKSIPDAMASIKDGTINSEMWAALHEGAAFVFLLLELDQGAIKTTIGDTVMSGYWPTSFALVSLLNYLVTVQRHGVILHISPDIRLTPLVIASLMNYSLKREHAGMYKHSVTEGPKQYTTLLSVPALSAHRAALLLERYSSLEEVLAASVSELAAIKGIGLNTARKVHAFWREHWQ